jgi:hypothetical protein
MIGQMFVDSGEAKVGNEAGEESNALGDGRLEFFRVSSRLHGLAMTVLLGTALACQLACTTIRKVRIAFDLFASAASASFVQPAKSTLLEG